MYHFNFSFSHFFSVLSHHIYTHTSLLNFLKAREAQVKCLTLCFKGSLLKFTAGLWKDLVPRTSLGLGSKYANIYLTKFGNLVNLAKVGWGRAQQEWKPGKLVNNSLTSPVT